MDLAKERYPHLSQVQYADSCASNESMPVDVLIGSDYMWEFLNGVEIRGEPGEPVAVSTKVGWVMSGPVDGHSRERLSSINFATTHVIKVASNPPTDELNRLWDFESIGIREKESVQEAFEKNIVHKDGRYMVKLPWMEHHKTLPDNYENSVARLKSQIRRLRRNPEVLKDYNAVIEDQVQKGVIEKVDTSASVELGQVHYLPHQAVVREEALTTKLRVVFDASSKSSQNFPSLNDCLNVGPALTPKIFEILLRFRVQRVAVVADIEKAFLSIGIVPNDRDFLRFLWIDDLENENPCLVTYRFCRVVFGVNASPFLLNATLQHHIKQCATNPELAEVLLNSFYVDDLVSGAENTEKAFELYMESKNCLSKGAFHLRKWASNSSELLEKIENDSLQVSTSAASKGVLEDTETYAKLTVGQPMGTKQVGEHKVLGIPWNCVSDKLCFNLESIVQCAEEVVPTKRNILKVIAKFYDPLGLLSPIMVLMKCLLQEMCKRKLDWDMELPDDIITSWQK